MTTYRSTHKSIRLGITMESAVPYLKTLSYFNTPEEYRMNFEKIRQAYFTTRGCYLRNCHTTRLKQRSQGLLQNLWKINNAHEPEIIPDQRLIHLYIETLCEKDYRKILTRSELNWVHEVKNVMTSYPKLKTNTTTSDTAACWTKFTDYPFALEAHQYGRLRIAPASSYKDPSLNAAQHDDELNHWSVTPNESLMVRFNGVSASGEKVSFTPEPLELLRGKNIQNYFVWCCGKGYNMRLYHDFECNAALVIHDTQAFSRRLSHAVEKHLKSSTAVENSVAYYDPYDGGRAELLPPFCKDFRYSYQQEYRFCWLLPHSEGLEPFFVELGSLEDISEVVRVLD